MEFNATFLVTIITFVIFVLLMNKILYAPILSIMEERKNFVDCNYKNAEDNDYRTQGLAEEKDEMLSQAKEEARGKYNQTLDEFKAQRDNEIENAHNVANNEILASNADLENLSNEVKNSLKGSMANLANDIVEKVIGYRSEVQNFDEEVVNKVLWEK